MAQGSYDDRFLREQAKALRKALAEAYARGEMQKALTYSRKLDALQLFLWKARSKRRAS